MGQGYKKYSNYISSETQWFGEIPSHWGFIRTKWLFEIKKRIAGKTGYQVLSITQQGVKEKDTESGEGQLSMDYSKYQVVHIGDFAMNHMDLLTGYIDISKFEGVTSPDYRVFSSSDTRIVHKYFLYIFQLCYSKKIYYSLGQGSSQLGRWRLPTDEFNNFCLMLPPLDEQKNIADFLDSETGKIDHLIDKQQQLIDLLKEKRQAVISQAVTKGLEPNVKMKDSGVEWLGEVPESWLVIRSKYICSIGTGDKDTENNEPDAQYPFFVRSDHVERISSYSYDGEAVLTAGDGAGVAKVFHYYDGKFDFHQRVYKFSDFKKILGKYFYFYISNFLDKEVLKLSAKSTVDSLRLPMLQNFVVAIPSNKEQKDILDYIEASIKRYDSLLEKAELSIDLMKERRVALISAAVTGKIDVRNWQADKQSVA